MSRPASRTSIHLEPPRKSVELVDPGARDLSSDGEEEYFSDASEGRRRSRPVTPASPIPRTRIEKLDDEPSYGEVPGTPAYEKRTQDAVPDEVEIVPAGRLSKRSSQVLERPTTPGGTLITPRTVIEKVDPDTPSYGDVPGTSAYLQRRMDAAPDVIVKTPEPGKRWPLSLDSDTNRPRSASNLSVPDTTITPVEDGSAVPRPTRVLDPAADLVGGSAGRAGSPARDGSETRPPFGRSPDRSGEGHDDGDPRDDLGDDFDDFEEGAQPGADDDFGDFDDGFPETEPPSPVSTSQINSIPPAAFPLIDFAKLTATPELLLVTQMHLDAMFPSTTADQASKLPAHDPLPGSSQIFPSDRSRSLWKQLITPPPLLPANWTQSRIRRLFLDSLGVPVDLDEILPPSKQKKLVLPDIDWESSSRKSESDRTLGSVVRLRAQAANESTGSLDSAQSGAKERVGRSKRPKGALAPPDLDLVTVKRLCATTDEKLDGMTEDELQAHVKELTAATEKTSELLEYWLKRRDGLRKEKEAFEGVLENLVRHARRVRK